MRPGMLVVLLIAYWCVTSPLVEWMRDRRLPWLLRFGACVVVYVALRLLAEH